MSERTFVLQVTQTRSAEITISEDDARRLFPEVRWNETDVSHAGDMEDSLDGGGNIPVELDQQLESKLNSSDDIGVDATFTLWEV